MGSVSEILNPIIDHPKLSTSFRGIRHSISSPEQQVWQFRGIKYANVPARFSQSTLNETFPTPIYDAITYGPKCPQPQFPLRLEDGLIGLPPGVATHSEDNFDEYNCLNLNITTPAGANERSNLPVLIYIHGGGGFSGSNGDWWTDGGSIVKRSTEIAKPVVAVAINYRLSILGYIGSEELGAEYGEKNIGNQGLRDAYMAIKWIYHNIHAFGGSPNNLTIYGESHGSVIVDFLLHSTSQFPSHVTRAITQSGQVNTPTSYPKSLTEHNDLYTSLKTHLNISTLSELQAIPYPDLLAAYFKADPGASVGPTLLVDGHFLDENWKESSFQGTIMTGNTSNEECVLQSVCAWFPAQTPRPSFPSLVSNLTPVIGAATLNSILTAYGISDVLETEELIDKLLKLAADIIFCQPAQSHAATWKVKGNEVQQYIFTQNQPFSGPYKGKSAHSLDLAYLHGNPEIFSGTADPEGERKVQRAIQDAWVEFAYGEDGWGKSGKMRRFGPGEVLDELPEMAVREWSRGDAWKSWEGLSSEQLAALVGLSALFVGGHIGFETPS
ncbi:alpha/beta-hydrolase [Hyaloscypha variabilis F]|uniref:Alpha/beta-hydrolase n=1 Tax=Hyaloscypha variabilis (strain UAMH 11265 / GT02V1 / F) TaxID=1149755 RepID=A0A2J6RR10_HYAVF|nr:alpha/beta-hydrolase [Hyaloscypha variabilis F]